MLTESAEAPEPKTLLFTPPEEAVGVPPKLLTSEIPVAKPILDFLKAILFTLAILLVVRLIAF